MIVDFTIKNFRSLRDEQTLSFYAERLPHHLSGNIHHPSNDIGVLAVAGIYGANASGKSNVFNGLNALCWLVSESHALKENATILTYEPYRLAHEKKNQPIEFTIEFVLSSRRYLYHIAYDQHAITEEKLSFYSVGESRTTLARLFERPTGASWEEISFGSHYKGGSKRIPLFSNQAYLSKAGNTPDAPQEIRDIYQYFLRKLVFLKINQYPLTVSWKKDPNQITKVSNFLSSVDTGINKLVIKEEKNHESRIQFPADMPEVIKSRIIEEVSHIPYFEHLTEEGGTEQFSQNEESHGTLALVNTLPFVFDALQTGKILVWDELESSLHPHVAELIVQLFNDPETNQNHAQLLFCTHNLALMNPETMRKDQLWLTEKNQGATQLICMDEFASSQLKNSSPFAKWYYDGRLGGIPAVNQTEIKNILLATMEAGNKYGKAP